MSEDGRCRTVLILTDTPDDYGADMERLGLTPLFAPTVSGLLDHLLDNPISGFVLEVQKVMRAQGAERDHLFKVSGAFPLLRVRRKAKGISYIDDLDHFLNRTRLFSPRKVRSQVRVPVRLNILLAAQDDAAFERAVRANLLDLSRSGGFAYTLEEFQHSQSLLVRILELADPAPIHAHVRWRRQWGLADTLPGIGLLFSDIRPGQLDELMTRYISPPAKAEPQPKKK